MVATSMVRVLIFFCVLWVLADTTWAADQRSDFHDAWQDKQYTIYTPDPVKMKKVNSMTFDEVAQELEKTKSTKQHPLYNAPLDVVFLITNTDLFLTSTRHALFIDKLNFLEAQFPGSRFGMSFFTDFVREDRLSAANCSDPDMKNTYHQDPEGCYKMITALTTVLYDLPPTQLIPAATAEFHVAGMAGILMAATDKKLGWDTAKDANRNRIIFVVSNLPTTCCKKPFGIKNKPKGDGTDTCMTMDDPEPEFVGKILREKKISLYLLLERVSIHLDEDVNNCILWSDMSRRMNVTFGMAEVVPRQYINSLKYLDQFVAYIHRVAYAN